MMRSSSDVCDFGEPKQPVSHIGIQKPGFFVNPICEGADPWITRVGNTYYFCQTEGHDGIAVCRSDRLTDKGIKRVVWRPRRRQWNSRDIWAPELHHLQGRWYIYYTASDGTNENHRTGVLGALSDDPQGAYEDLGILYTGDEIETGRNNRWSIDATPLEIDDRLYLIWSGWQGNEDVQHLYIAPMNSPFRISGNRVRLCANDCYPWERINENPELRGLNEGPQILKRHGRIFLIYSCSSSWDPTYKLNLLWMNESEDPLDPHKWTKSASPVLQSSQQVFGIGHASFTTSPDETQDWILFHAKRSRTPGWQRAIWAQPFTWDKNGFPDFGIPLSAGTQMQSPSGEPVNKSGVLFQSDFTTPHWDNWVYYGHGRYIRIDEQSLHLGGKPARGAVNVYRSGEKALIRGYDWSDFNLRAQIRLHSASSQAGLLLRVREPGLGSDAYKGHSVMLSSGDQAVIVGASNGLAWRPVHEIIRNIEVGKWYELGIEARGETIRLHLDNVAMAEFQSGNHLAGMLGVYVKQGHGEFRNITIRHIGTDRQHYHSTLDAPATSCLDFENDTNR